MNFPIPHSPRALVIGLRAAARLAIQKEDSRNNYWLNKAADAIKRQDEIIEDLREACGPAGRLIVLHETTLQSWLRDGVTLAVSLIWLALALATKQHWMGYLGAIGIVGLVNARGSAHSRKARMSPQDAADYIAMTFDRRAG
jgi:hypothetical protein